VGILAEEEGGDEEARYREPALIVERIGDAGMGEAGVVSPAVTACLPEFEAVSFFKARLNMTKK
jgi:hypothetical protein